MLSLNHYGAKLCNGLPRREWLRMGADSIDRLRLVKVDRLKPFCKHQL